MEIINAIMEMMTQLIVWLLVGSVAVIALFIVAMAILPYITIPLQTLLNWGKPGAFYKAVDDAFYKYSLIAPIACFFKNTFKKHS